MCLANEVTLPAIVLCVVCDLRSTLLSLSLVFCRAPRIQRSHPLPSPPCSSASDCVLLALVFPFFVWFVFSCIAPAGLCAAPHALARCLRGACFHSIRARAAMISACTCKRLPRMQQIKHTEHNSHLLCEQSKRAGSSVATTCWNKRANRQSMTLSTQALVGGRGQGVWERVRREGGCARFCRTSKALRDTAGLGGRAGGCRRRRPEGGGGVDRSTRVLRGGASPPR